MITWVTLAPSPKSKIWGIPLRSRFLIFSLSTPTFAGRRRPKVGSERRRPVPYEYFDFLWKLGVVRKGLGFFWKIESLKRFRAALLIEEIGALQAQFFKGVPQNQFKTSFINFTSYILLRNRPAG